jgi:hypothetical protein
MISWHILDVSACWLYSRHARPWLIEQTFQALQPKPLIGETKAAEGLFAMPFRAMRRGARHGLLVAFGQLAGPFGHDRRVDLRVMQPQAAQVLMNGAEMDSKLRGHGRIGLVGMGQKGSGHAAAAGRKSAEEARQRCRSVGIGGGFHFMCGREIGR